MDQYFITDIIEPGEEIHSTCTGECHAEYEAGSNLEWNLDFKDTMIVTYIIISVLYTSYKIVCFLDKKILKKNI